MLSTLLRLLAAKDVIKTALCVEERGGHLYALAG